MRTTRAICGAFLCLVALASQLIGTHWFVALMLSVAGIAMIDDALNWR